ARGQLRRDLVLDVAAADGLLAGGPAGAGGVVLVVTLGPAGVLDHPRDGIIGTRLAAIVGRADHLGGTVDHDRRGRGDVLPAARALEGRADARVRGHRRGERDRSRRAHELVDAAAAAHDQVDAPLGQRAGREVEAVVRLAARIPGIDARATA